MTQDVVARRSHAVRPRRSAAHSRLARAALRWFDRNQRQLPWRTNKSRYRVWVSEIMLQQTQVATVIPYFRRFVRRFPSVASLAAADESDVLRLWEGLGYYRRARQLHRAAQMIVTQFGGRCPTEFDEWLTLPGIGRYTAGAILSISEDRRLPILEANTIRLHSRRLALRDDPGQADSLRRLWMEAAEVVPRRRAGDFNQALMEIGSQICLPRNPRCCECPLRGDCLAHRRGLVQQIPRRRPRADTTHLRQIAVVVRRGNNVLLRHLSSEGRWSGLWDVPRFEIGRDQKLNEIPEAFKKLTGLTIDLGTPRFTIRHSVTRYRIELCCHEGANVRGTLRSRPGSGWAWVSISAVRRIPLNITARRIVRQLTRGIRSSA